jgi:Na+-transporting methylmalonyl-CoA/oxaloacetate decarboxylase gamma subunit
MTTQPPPPPAPPGPEAVARLRAENEALQLQVQNQALREASGAFAGDRPGAQPGNVSVIKNEEGRVVVTTPDGRTVVYDPKVGFDEDAVQRMIQTALEPPRIPQPPRRGPPESVMIVAVVFSFLLLMTLVISVASVLRRRAAANASASATPADLGARLARIEQAVEAVAIEVERISESERYSARLLTERLPDPAARPNGDLQRAPAAQPTVDAPR